MKVVVSGLPCVVVDEVLEERAADALHRAAGDLAFDDRRVDHHAAVLADDVAQQRDHAGVRIDLDRADVARVREHERQVGLVAVQDLEARLHARRQTRRGRGTRRGRSRRRCGTAWACRGRWRRRRRRRCRRARLPAGGRRSSATFCRAARWAAPWIAAPRIGPLRLPPVPNAYGVSLVSPWWTVTSS